MALPIQTTFPGDARTINQSPAPVIGGDVLRRAVLFALVIGSVLVLVNQSGAIFGNGEIERLQLILVYVTPFVVAVISQMLGIRRAAADARQFGFRRLGGEPALATVLAHGIPMRAVLVGLVVGSVNGSIVLIVGLLENVGAGGLPVAVLTQAYILPMLFGVLSQTIAYRRATRTLRNDGAVETQAARRGN